MDKKAIIISFAIVTLLTSPAFAVGAGTLPTSPFYIFDEFSESFKLFFTRDPMTKARVQLEIAEERLAECDALPTTAEKELWCPRLMTRYEENINSTLALLNTTRNRSSDVSNIIEQATSRHIQVLQSLLNRTPAIARPALERALNVSQLGQPAITPLRRVLIEEISRTLDAPETKGRISQIVENATRTGNFTEQAREEIKTSIREEIKSTIQDVEGTVLTRIETYVREKGTTDIRDVLEAFRRGLEGQVENLTR